MNDQNTAPAQEMLDVPFSQLFGGDDANATPTTAPTPETPQTSTTPAAVQPPADPAPVPTPTPQVFELKTRTGTVYKSIDDAVQGIEHKDALISQLRNFALEKTGIDPLTGQQVLQQPQQQQMPQTKQPQSYLQDPNQYFKDLYDAYANNDPQAYFKTQERLMEEKLNAATAPILPVLQNFAKQSALDQVNTSVPEFRNFHSSPQFQETLQTFPALANAIQVSENRFEFSQQLPDLYKMAYQLHQAKTLPDLIKQQQAANPPQAPRPTAAPTHVTPPATSTMPRNANLMDADARKVVIEAFEKSGKADMGWRS